MNTSNAGKGERETLGLVYGGPVKRLRDRRGRKTETGRLVMPTEQQVTEALIDALTTPHSRAPKPQGGSISPIITQLRKRGVGSFIRSSHRSPFQSPRAPSTVTLRNTRETRRILAAARLLTKTSQQTKESA